ncbi:hypothetical protein FSP39_018426 [Pinctada imbricata]|uniref:Tudor domain-containing protein n=1 Tax=Pinctada imbricata TaxID=66713 RepID=A0AA88Y5E2_PINIB|nr:hypothetical protein FSP39_018426 [Pinctada imbricata]
MNNSKFPVRPGISWKKGERVEAMDFMNKWYPAKIVDIEEDEQSVMIHFDGWNSRYDEWVPMTSEKLRPRVRYSSRKDKPRHGVCHHNMGVCHQNRGGGV